MPVEGSDSVSPIPVRYDSEWCVVRLQQRITAQSIFMLCEEVDLAINYYQYGLIVIEIDCLGGDTQYLEYYFLKLQNWIDAGVIVRTVALTIAASASAYILACGSPGERASYPAARIVFHYGSSVTRSDTTMTSVELERRAKRIAEIDSQFENLVVDAVVEAIRRDKHTHYPIIPKATDKQELEKSWGELGVSQRPVLLGRTVDLVNHVREVVDAIHVNGSEITPRTALSLLFIDEVSSVYRAAQGVSR